MQPLATRENPVATGGFQSVLVPAATAGTVIKAAPGRICRVIVQANMATTALTFFDNALGTATGNILGIVKITAVAGDIIDLEMPAQSGISAVGGAGQAACLVSFN